MSVPTVLNPIIDAVIDSLAQGKAPWRKPWRSVAGGLPVNIASKKAYRGMNILILGMTPYTDARWGTFKQWSDVGARIRKGEKATSIMLWQFKPMHTKGADGKPAFDTNGNPLMADIPLVRLYAVFNAEQVDGAPAVPDAEPAGEGEELLTPDATAEALMADYLTRSGVHLRVGGSVASFAPGTDTIAMPPLAQFAGVSEYYGTLLHEAVHSTGTKDRCNREGITKFDRFGSGRYAFEELVAEMGGAMLVSQCGLAQPEVTENTIAYLAGWAERIKADRQALISAASACAKAVDYINGTTYTA